MELPYKIENNTRIFDWNQTCHYLIHIGKLRYGQSFTLHKQDLKIIYRLVLYIIRDEENCQQRNIDLNKGILLLGPVGCGKTSLMTLIQELAFPEFRYRVKPTRDIAFEFQKEGYDIIHRYGKSKHTICLDDLGVERNIKFYGNECNTIGEILLHRYDLLIHSGTITHATTNLNAEELEQMYGNRVRSRLREMFNLISFPVSSQDKRK